MSLICGGCYRATLDNIATGMVTYDSRGVVAQESTSGQFSALLCSTGDVILSTATKLLDKVTLITQGTINVEKH